MARSEDNMSLVPLTARLAAEQPFTAASALRTLDLTTSDATITSLAAGTWEAFNGGSAHAVASLTGATTSMPPSTGAAEETAFMVPAGGSSSFFIAASTTLHAKLLSGTGTLYLHRKVT
jgi:hypothetical protein